MKQDNEHQTVDWNRTCARTACDNPLKRGFWRIFNVPSVVNGYRDYCTGCGREIHRFSVGTDYEFKYDIFIRKSDATNTKEKDQEDSKT